MTEHVGQHYHKVVFLALGTTAGAVLLILCHHCSSRNLVHHRSNPGTDHSYTNDGLNDKHGTNVALEEIQGAKGSLPPPLSFLGVLHNLKPNQTSLQGSGQKSHKR